MLAPEQLYEKYKPEVYGYLLSLTRDAQAAEELLSECFLAAVRQLPFFRGDSSVKTWLFGIARNCYLRRLKKRYRELPMDGMALAYLAGAGADDAADGVLRQVIRRQLCQRVFALLEQEDARTQQVVKLRLNGYAYREIAERLHLSEGSARVLDHRAKKRLRERLEKEGYDLASDGSEGL